MGKIGPKIIIWFYELLTIFVVISKYLSVQNGISFEEAQCLNKTFRPNIKGCIFDLGSGSYISAIAIEKCIYKQKGKVYILFN